MKKCIFVFLASFVLMCGSVVPVSAYTDLNGYPIIMDNMMCDVYSITETGEYITHYSAAGVLQEQNSYFFDFSNTVSSIGNIRFGNLESSVVVPINLDAYDYYVVGTIGFTSGTFGSISGAYFLEYDNGLVYNPVHISTVDFVNYSGFNGKSFYGQLERFDTGNFNYLQIEFSDRQNLSADVWFSGSIVPVVKGSDATAVMNSILQKLTEINNNLISTNEILTQHDSNVSKWFQDLITRMGIGFNALYQQMTKEQDEKLNGYDGSVASGAKDEFDSGASDLTAIEGTLNSSSTTYVNDFTSTGFDAGILATLGASLTFVVTWFTNFWNMGGIWTVGLSTCFAIWIAFYILRTRGK